jgi:hypothetical protein
LCPLPAFSWWELGHQTVARIAAAHLTAAARTRVARILDVPNTPTAVADALARASTWADETKNETHTGDWHYIDLALQDKRSDIPARCPHENCAPARVLMFAEQLRSGHADTRWSELDALRYVVHLVGDEHQPLHDVSDADLGGNCERLDPPIGQAKNLHAFWDGQLPADLGGDQASLTLALDAEIAKLSPRQQAHISAGNADDWAWEGHKLAQKVIYARLRIPLEPVVFPPNCSEAPESIRDFHPAMGSSYVNNMKPIVRLQLERAGLRLAKLLNDSL